MVNSSPLPLTAKVSAGHPFFDLIEEAYRVFDYPTPSSTGVCQYCCMNSKIEADFFNPPIRQLPLEYIQDWYWAAYEEKGVPKATWAYLLPRLLEILAAGEDLSTNALEVGLSRFDTGNSKNWSTKEWAVLDRFQRMFLQHSIENGVDHLDDVICMFKLGGWPLDELLDQIEAIPSEKLAICLWKDWCAWRAEGQEDVWMTAFWEDEADRAKMHDFYLSDRLYDKINALAVDVDTDPELAIKALAVAIVMRP